MAKKKKGSSSSARDDSTAGSGGYAAVDAAAVATAASHDTLGQVQAWLQRRGGVADPSKITLREANGDRSVVAVADLAKGETLFRVPAPLWFSAEGLSAHQAGQAALQWAQRAAEEVGLSAEHVELCLLAVLMLLEKSRPGSQWLEYVAALPWNASLPLTWSPEKLSSLNGAAPQWQIEDKRRELTSAYASLTGALKGAAKDSFLSACPSVDPFITAFALAHSRAMGISSKGEEGRRWTLAMLPFADMLNHSREPEMDWDVVRSKDAELCILGRTLCNVKAGSELHIRYRQFASAQAFFATYGFVEDAEKVLPTELRFAVNGAGPPPVLTVASTMSLRKLLSCYRLEVALEEELRSVSSTKMDAARFPLSLRCEMAAFQRLHDEVRQRVKDCAGHKDGVDSTVQRLRAADAAGWERLASFASSVLKSLQDLGSVDLSVARLGVLVHSKMPLCTSNVQVSSESATFVSPKMTIRDEGGDKGRGYFANRSISAGELLLSEAPHIFDPEDDDFGALAAIHAMAAEEEGSELRVPSSEVDVKDTEAFRWLEGMRCMTKEKLAKALAAARNNGFCTSADSDGKEAWLLFRKLSVFNHSCWPTCSVYRNPSNGVSHVLTIRPVEKGTELSIHYSDDLILLPKDLRKVFLPGRFGFVCECDRCEEEDQAAAKVEALLQQHAEGRSDTLQEETQLAHAMKKAHAGLCKMRQERGRPSGFVYRDFANWEEALAAVDAAMPDIAAYGALTHWSRHHARGLRCLALEALQRDAVGYLALAEHAAASWRLLPRYCDAVRLLHQRLRKVESRLPSALQQRLRDKALDLYAEGLQGLERDMAKLEGWLKQAGALPGSNPEEDE